MGIASIQRRLSDCGFAVEALVQRRGKCAGDAQSKAVADFRQSVPLLNRRMPACVRRLL